VSASSAPVCALLDWRDGVLYARKCMFVRACVRVCVHMYVCLYDCLHFVCLCVCCIGGVLVNVQCVCTCDIYVHASVHMCVRANVGTCVNV
jgi:hypothetical protein